MHNAGGPFRAKARRLRSSDTVGGPFRVNARRLHDSVLLHLPRRLRGGPGEDGLCAAAGVATLLIAIYLRICAAASLKLGSAPLPVSPRCSSSAWQGYVGPATSAMALLS